MRRRRRRPRRRKPRDQAQDVVAQRTAVSTDPTMQTRDARTAIRSTTRRPSPAPKETLMTLTRLTLALATAGFVTTLITACGSNGNTEESPPVVIDPPAPTTTDIKTTVIDGPLANATVCMDKNNNGACDADEVSGKTAADGSVTLKVPNADVGKFDLLAIVGTDAVDSVSGPVTSAYALRAPADQAAVISPLTTLVKVHMEMTGDTSAASDKAVQDAANVSASMFSDFAKTTDTSGLAPLARLLVLTTQGANTALASVTATETKDSSGNVITKTDVSRAIGSRMLDVLPAIAEAANSDAVTSATTPAAKEAALKAAAATLQIEEVALTPTNIKVVAAAARAPVEPVAPATPVEAASLAWLTYTDANNWYFRYLSSTAAQATPDAAGKVRFVDNRKRAVSGTVQRWGETSAYTRTDARFDGTTWVVCATGYVHSATVRDAAGRSTYNYCNDTEGASLRRTLDISGQLMADVVAQIRAYPLFTTSGAYASWGPTPNSLGTARFPANASLQIQGNTSTRTADSYNTLDSNVVVLYNAAVAAGGSASTDECQKVTPTNFASFQFTPTTLEQLVSTFVGKPCVYTPNATVGSRSEWWTNSSINLGSIDSPAPALPFYRAGRNLRVAFSGGTGVKYFSCAMRASDGSSRNCDTIGTGTFSIEVVGDARVMRFANLPASTNSLGYKRIFVERGGKLYFGFRDKLGVDNNLRLNKEAMDALLAQLNLTR
jgi:trimeric autotransporter adhesin